jgi:hypothetical protein
MLPVGPTAIPVRAAAVEEARTDACYGSFGDGCPVSPVSPDKSSLGSRRSRFIHDLSCTAHIAVDDEAFDRNPALRPDHAAEPSPARPAAHPTRPSRPP